VLPTLTSIGKTPKATDLNFNQELHNLHGGKMRKYAHQWRKFATLSLTLR
jgi:hypothetical protein